mmetsp:Transcript_7037/g.19990  ORF Transcript_7037/g.19990 Transcript_7037/m.19990 type:complete len:288 (-) Transcript_7037:87-950(-)
MGIRAFYEDAVPRARRKLGADRYMLLLSFMDSPHSGTAAWLAERRRQDPENFAAVVYDAHMYHSFGDNAEPWSADVDTCKTCCRDLHILEPVSSLGLPLVVGEFSLATGFGGWGQNGFPQMFLDNQWSLFNTTSGVVGSFLWNFRLLLAEARPRWYLEWSLLDLVDAGYLAEDGAYGSDLAVLCPDLPNSGKVLGKCPSYESQVVYWDSPCGWGPLLNTTTATTSTRTSTATTSTATTTATATTTTTAEIFDDIDGGAIASWCGPRCEWGRLGVAVAALGLAVAAAE